MVRSHLGPASTPARQVPRPGKYLGPASTSVRHVPRSGKCLGPASTSARQVPRPGKYLGPARTSARQVPRPGRYLGPAGTSARQVPRPGAPRLGTGGPDPIFPWLYKRPARVAAGASAGVAEKRSKEPELQMLYRKPSWAFINSLRALRPLEMSWTGGTKAI